MRRPVLSLVMLVAVVCFAFTSSVAACPFCAAVSQTFTEEIDTMDAVVIAELVKLPPKGKPGEVASTQEAPKATFKVIQAVKGKTYLNGVETIQTVYFGDGKLGKSFLIMGVDPPKLMWSTPLQITERARKYIPTLLALPKAGAKRLEFFQKHLEDEDEMLARDAYDEFAKAPYADVIALKQKMDHERIVGWIQDQDIPASRRRLYLTMLGVCGTEKDLPMLEKMLRSDDRKTKAGLDAMIGCYLTLKGADGMPLIEDLFLKNDEAEYADTYAAIMALRFHGSETDIIPRKRILQGLRHMLDRPQLADLVIPDLARWEDWDSMPKLVALFKEADDKSSWVRVPVINYLRACPKPDAAKYISELEKIDPAAVKRANTFFPFGGAAGKPAAKTEAPAKS